MNIIARLKSVPRDRFVIFALVMIFLGVGLRFTGLEKKQYWKDEASASMVASGHCIFELFGKAQGGTFKAGRFFDLQKARPDRGVVTAFARVSSDESSHAPLYYVALRAWMGMFGDSVASVRSFSAFLSLALIPAMYFLCENLFGSAMAGWIGAMLVAVSPVQFLFAQEAREYILWLLMTALSSVALLRNHWRSYLILCLLDIYSSFLALFVAAGQIGFYLLTRKHENPDSGKSRAFWAARIATVAVSLPILINMFLHIGDIRRATHWMERTPQPSKYLRAVLSGLYRVFFDLNLPTGAKFTQYPFQAVTIAFLLLGLAFAVIYFFLRADRRSRIFVGLLMASALVPTFGLDMMIGGRRALSARFLLTFYLALQMVVVFGISKLFASHERRLKWAGRSLAVFLGLIGLYSIYTNSRSEVWWNKGMTGDYRVMAKALDNAPSPRLIISQDYRESLAISRYIDPSIEIMNAPPFPDPSGLVAWKSVFVLFGDPDENPDFYENQRVKVKWINGKLWRLELSNSL